jgi:hypothetical protein
VLSHSLDFAQSFFGFCHSAQSFCVFISDFMISSIILCFLNHFVRHRGGGGRGTSGRGAGRRRMRHSPAGRRGVEEAGAPVGEVMGGGGRGAHRWWGGARRSKKRCSSTGEVWGGGGRGAMCGRRGVGRCRVGSHRVGRAMQGWVTWDRESRCRSGSVGSDGWRGVGQVGGVDVRRVGRLDCWVQVMDLWSITLGDE